MPKKSSLFLLSILSLSLLTPPAQANSINNLADIESTVTLLGVDRAGSLFALTPSTLVRTVDREYVFASTLPTNWTNGEAVTFSLSFDNQTFSGSGNAFGPSHFEFAFGFPAISQKFPATVTVTFANGGTSTASFIIAPAPEPGTMLLFGTGGLLLALAIRARRRTAGKPIVSG
jgi:hypothetical protein